MSTNDVNFFDEVFDFVGAPGPGWTPLAFLEHYYDGKPVPMSNRIPDPHTFRDEYYYNTRQNILYRKIITPAIGCSDQQIKVWKAISER